MVEFVDCTFKPELEHSDFILCCLILLCDAILFFHRGQRNQNFFQLVYAYIRNGGTNGDVFQGRNALLAFEKCLDVVRVSPAFVQLNNIQIAVCQNPLILPDRCNGNLVRITILRQDEIVVLQTVFLIFGFDAG